MRSRQILIIGGGPAGVFAAISAKKQDPSATVTLLTREAGEPYEKPPLSKAVLVGRAAPEDAPIAGPNGIAGHGVHLETCADCAVIDRGSHSVMLADGRRVGYDALVMATGCLPCELSQLPVGTPRVHYLRTDTDARALEAALREAGSLLVIGGGLIGLEVAASATERGVKVTVLEAAPRILSRVCDKSTAAAVHGAHVQRGVDIRVSTMLATSSATAAGPIAAVTANGDRLVADLVVVGTGSKPDTRLAAAAGLAVDDGVLVDANCRTSDPAIFAAGDCVRFPGPDGLVRLENWRHAIDQGTVAGRNAAENPAGDNVSYSTVPSFWSEQYDLYIQGVGWQAAGAARVNRPLTGGMLAFDVLEGKVVSAMGINVQRDLAMARRLIERGVPVESGALADPGQPLAGMLKNR